MHAQSVICRKQSHVHAGADPNTTDDEGQCILYLLIEVGGANPVIIKELLRHGANPNKTTWSLQQTPLHVAARRGYQVCIKILVHAGARVDKRDSAGNTPLMYAVKEGHVSAIKALLREGARTDSRNFMNESALHFAAGSGHQQAAIELLQRGVNPNCRDTRGLSPLFVACRNNHVKLVESLLDFNCDVNIQDAQSGRTLLHWAIQHGNLKLVLTLLEASADPNIRDKNWQTPFMLALSVGRRDILEVLLQFGCSVKNTDFFHNTPLHLASRDGQTDLITLIVEGGVSVNVKGERGLTPLMLAAFGGHVNTVRLLQNSGAYVDLMDRHRCTALMYTILSNAPEPNCREIVKMLVRANCNLDQCANLKNLMQESSRVMLPGNVHLEERLYSPMEAAYLKGRTVVVMMLVKVGCDTRSFRCAHAHGLPESRHMGTELRERWQLLRTLQTVRGTIRSLKELCRKPLLAKLASFSDAAPVQRQVAKLPVSDHLKAFLNFPDLEQVEHQFGIQTQPRLFKWKSCNMHEVHDDPDDAFSRSDPRRRAIPPGSNSYRAANIRDRSRPNSRSASFRSNESIRRDSPKRRSLPPGFYSSLSKIPTPRATSASPVRTTRSQVMGFPIHTEPVSPTRNARPSRLPGLQPGFQCGSPQPRSSRLPLRSTSLSPIRHKDSFVLAGTPDGSRGRPSSLALCRSSSIPAQPTHSSLPRWSRMPDKQPLSPRPKASPRSDHAATNKFLSRPRSFSGSSRSNPTESNLSSPQSEKPLKSILRPSRSVYSLPLHSPDSPNDHDFNSKTLPAKLKYSVSFEDVENPEEFIDFMRTDKFKSKFGYKAMLDEECFDSDSCGNANNFKTNRSLENKRHSKIPSLLRSK